MPKISDAELANRSLALVRATWVVIAQVGLENVTLDLVSRETGKTSGMVYGHFSNRDELVAAAVTRALAELGHVLAEGTRGISSSPLQLFQAVIDAFSERAVSEPFAMATASAVAASRPHLVEPDSVIAREYNSFKGRVLRHAQNWVTAGSVPQGASASGWADVMTSLLWGYFQQRPLSNHERLLEHHRSVLSTLSQSSDASGSTVP